MRVMLETGTRAGEVVALELGDVDLINGALTVRRGKGGKGRVVPFGPEASLALDRYLRLRRAHRLAASPRPVARRPRQALLLRRPAQDAPRPRRPAGLVGFHPHSCATPPRTAGSPPVARSPGSWPWPAGPGRHAHALHQGPGVRTRGRGGPQARTWGSCDRNREMDGTFYPRHQDQTCAASLREVPAGHHRRDLPQNDRRRTDVAQCRERYERKRRSRDRQTRFLPAGSIPVICSEHGVGCRRRRALAVRGDLERLRPSSRIPKRRASAPGSCCWRTARQTGNVVP